MVIPLWVLLVPVGLIVLLVAAFAGINVVQVHRFGFLSIVALLVLLLFLAVAGLIAFQTLQALPGVDWNAPLFTFRFSLDVPDTFGQ